MIYHSTRNEQLTASSTHAVLQGIAPDGGLYICDPAALRFDWRAALEKDTLSMAADILHALLPDFQDMDRLVRDSYAGKFPTSDLTPLTPVADKYVLELYHGPTSAFKDVALSVLPRLIVAAAKAEGMKGDVVILTATSGDTGKAAHGGLPRRARHPYHRVLPLRRRLRRSAGPDGHPGGRQRPRLRRPRQL